MKIKSIELFLAEIKLKQRFTTSLISRDHTYNIFVKVTSDERLYGWGECSPNPVINGETAETCMITGRMLANSILGKDPREHEQIMFVMDRVLFSNTSIKSAIDIACHDLAARSEEKPLYLYLGGSVQKKIYTDYTVSVNDVEKMVIDALRVKELGFPSIKIKLGDGKGDDVERVRAIRKAVGSEMDLRVDANQGWQVKQAISILNEIAHEGVQYCEEPISRRNYFKLKKIKRQSSTPVMADESLFDHYDAKKLIKGDHCDMFNLKLGKSSGLLKAQKIIELATKANMEMQIGGFLGGKIVMTANCHLAHTHELIKYFDFDSPLFHSIDPIQGGIEYQKDWEIRLPESAGLGVDVDKTFLKQCESILIQ